MTHASADRPESPSGQHRERAPGSARVAVLTMSDTRTREEDRSGEIIRQSLSWRGLTVASYEIIPDDPELIREQIHVWLNMLDIDAVITNGGTGISNRDSTYDIVAAMLDKRLDGFGELFRMLSYQEIGAAAMLSRAVAGTIGSKVIFCLPGSSNAVKLAMEKLIGPELLHVIYELRKQG